MAAHHDILWAIMRDERVSAPAKCLATVLLLRFQNHDTKQCNPSFAAIAACVGRKRRAVIDAANELRAAGWMSWTGTLGGASSNTNNFQFYREPLPVQSTAPVQHTTPVQSTALTGAVERTLPVQSAAHELSIEPSKNQPRERRARAKVLPRDFGLDLETQLWAESRLGSLDAVEASMFKFTNHHHSKGNRFVDWMARARIWIEDDARDAEKAIADDKSVVAAAKRLTERLSSFDAGPSAVVLSTDEWRKALTLFQRTGTWSKYVDVYGSAPPSPDCKAPRHLLIEFGLLREDAA